MSSVTQLFSPDILIDVVDIGAALYEQPLYEELVAMGKARVFGFEPNEEAYQKLLNHYKEGYQFFPFIIGDGEQAIFHETNFPMTSSIYKPNSPLLDKFHNLGSVTVTLNESTVDTKRLDDIPEIENVDLFKIDVQGAELKVFENATEALEKTLVVQAEVEFLEMYENQPMFADVDIFLREHGFQFHKFQTIGSRCFRPLYKDNDLNEGINQIIWGDAVYVRDWMKFEQLSEEKLQKYAVIMHDLYGSHDLVYTIIAEIDNRNGSQLAGNYIHILNS